MPPHGVPAAEEDELELSEAQRLAEEYHDLLNQQKLGLKTVDTEESEGAGADIRLVPQPLFHSLKASSKRPSMPYRASSRNSSAATPAIRDTRQDIRKKKRRSSLKEAMRMPSFPLKLSLTPTPTKRRSTSGSIPISPPISPDSNASSPHQSPTFAPHYQQPALRIETDPSRFDPSHRFPSTAHRISRNGGNASPQSAPSLISPRSPPPAVDDNPTIGHRRMASDDGSTVSSEKFFSRLFQRRNNDHPVPAMTTAGVKPIDGTSALATRSSPSDKSPKVSQWSPETPTPKTPRLVHSIAPSRPTDERGAALREGLTQEGQERASGPRARDEEGEQGEQEEGGIEEIDQGSAEVGSWAYAPEGGARRWEGVVVTGAVEVFSAPLAI
ncbi:hypothetical protein H2203_004288 [Taxawa tesnikishii (nom. ined.)]|nr:hypothetical protein H2203_004288 [Dothideales sp. JES 119]